MPPHALCVGGCEFRYYDSKCLIDAETVLDLQMAIIGLLFDLSSFNGYCTLIDHCYHKRNNVLVKQNSVH